MDGPDEFAKVAQVDGWVFGVDYADADRADVLSILDPTRIHVAVDDGAIVGVTGAYTKALTLPGLAQVPAAGITWVSVLSTHRRRGILTQLLATQRAAIAERGEPISILYASESAIYERFGYGIATMNRQVQIDPRLVRFRPGVPDGGGLRLVDATEARGLLPPLYDAHHAAQPGSVSRDGSWWDYLFLDKQDWRGGLSARRYVVHDEGFASYRLGEDGEAFKLGVADFVALTPAAHAALWRFLLSVDLVTVVETRDVPLHDPLPWLLDHPRRVRTSDFGDRLWVRLNDVEAALSARSWATDDELVVEVLDGPTTDGTAGRYLLDGGGCTRTDRTPDLVMGLSELGSLSLGGVAATMLGRAGRIDERTPGALWRAEAMFSSDPPPFNTTAF